MSYLKERKEIRNDKPEIPHVKVLEPSTLDLWSDESVRKAPEEDPDIKLLVDLKEYTNRKTA